MTPDAHLRLAQAAAWMENGSLALPAEVGDPTHGNVAVLPDGRRFMVYNPGQSLLFLPLLLATRSGIRLTFDHYHYTAAFAGSFLGPLCLAACALVLYRVRLLLLGAERDAALVALVFFFGTVAMPHAADAYEHPEEGLALLFAVAACISSRLTIDDARSRRLAFMAGLAVGIGLLFRNSALFALPGLVVLTKPRRLLNFAVGLTPGLLIVAGYNFARFGDLFTSGYRLAWPLMQPTPPPDAGPFVTPIWTGLSGLWLSPGKGMLWFSPILLVALAGWPAWARRRSRESFGLWLIIGTYAVIYAKNFAWHGSAWCWGPRYLVPIVPLVLLGMPPLPTPNRRCNSLLAILVALSISVQLLALSVDYRRQLLELHVEHPQLLASDEYYWSIPASPLVRQARALAPVLKRSCTQDEFPQYLPPGPWRNERREATIEMMLATSLDMNSLNFWWIRVQYLRLPKWTKRSAVGIACLLGIALGLGVAASVGLSTRSPQRLEPSAVS